MNLVDELYAVTAALEAAGITYAVCGGIAVTIHGATRTTRDIDLLVPGDRLTAVLDAVRPLGYVFAAIPMTFDAGTPKERLVQRVTKVEGAEHLVLDLIVEAGAFAGLLADRVEVPLEKGRVSVVSLAALTRMKRLAGRAQDKADLERLGVDGDTHD